jgi:hypothetical protein
MRQRCICKVTPGELVEYFGKGNGSAYLRETMKIMTSVSALVRRELKGRD